MSEYDLILEAGTAEYLKSSFQKLSEKKLAEVDTEKKRVIRLMQLNILEILSNRGMTTDFLNGYIVDPKTKKEEQGKVFGYIRGGQVAAIKNAVLQIVLIKRDNGIYTNVELIWFPPTKKKTKLQEVYSLKSKPKFTRNPSDD